MAGKKTSSQLPLGHLKEGRKAAAIKGVLWSGWNSLAPVLSGLVVFWYSSKLLSPTDFGTIAMVTAIVVVCSAGSFSGFGEAIIQAQDLDERHLNAVFWLCVGAGTVIYVLVCLSASLLTDRLEMPLLHVMLLYTGTKIILDAAATVPNALLARSMAFAKVARRTTIASFVSAIVCLLLLMSGWGVWSLATNLILLSAINWLAALYSQAWRPKLQFDRTAVADLWSYGLFSSGTRLIQAFSVDQLLIGSFLGPAQLGLYSFARRIFQMFSDLISGALSAVSHALLSSLQTEQEKVREGFLAAVFISSLISFPIFGGLAVIAPELVSIVFGNKWEGATFTLQVFSCIGFLTCIGALQASLITSQGRARWWMNYQIFQQILTFGVVVSTYRLGVDVLIAAIAIKTFLTWPVTIHAVLRILKISLLDYFGPFVGPALGTAVMVASVLIWKHFYPVPQTYLGLSALIILGSIAYMMIAVPLCGSRLLLLFRRSSAV